MGDVHAFVRLAMRERACVCMQCCCLVSARAMERVCFSQIVADVPDPDAGCLTRLLRPSLGTPALLQDRHLVRALAGVGDDGKEAARSVWGAFTHCVCVGVCVCDLRLLR